MTGIKFNLKFDSSVSDTSIVEQIIKARVGMQPVQIKRSEQESGHILGRTTEINSTFWKDAKLFRAKMPVHEKQFFYTTPRMNTLTIDQLLAQLTVKDKMAVIGSIQNSRETSSSTTNGTQHILDYLDQ